jgi:hypothetical protein
MAPSFLREGVWGRVDLVLENERIPLSLAKASFRPHPVKPSGLPPLFQMQANLDQDFQPSKGEGNSISAH